MLCVHVDCDFLRLEHQHAPFENKETLVSSGSIAENSRISVVLLDKHASVALVDSGEVRLLTKALQEFVVAEENVHPLIVHLDVVFMEFLQVVQDFLKAQR